MRTLLLTGVLLTAALTAAAAQGLAPPNEPECSEGSTVDIEQCLARRTAEWDRRLNAAYQKVMDQLKGEQRERMRAAQRLWIQYRDANCAVFGAGEGTIVRIETALCRRNMTAARALELEDLVRN